MITRVQVFAVLLVFVPISVVVVSSCDSEKAKICAAWGDVSKETLDRLGTLTAVAQALELAFNAKDLHDKALAFDRLTESFTAVPGAADVGEYLTGEFIKSQVVDYLKENTPLKKANETYEALRSLTLADQLKSGNAARIAEEANKAIKALQNISGYVKGVADGLNIASPFSQVVTDVVRSLRAYRNQLGGDIKSLKRIAEKCGSSTTIELQWWQGGDEVQTVTKPECGSGELTGYRCRNKRKGDECEKGLCSGGKNRQCCPV